jgi:hypothetical protein
VGDSAVGAQALRAAGKCEHPIHAPSSDGVGLSTLLDASTNSDMAPRDEIKPRPRTRAGMRFRAHGPVIPLARVHGIPVCRLSVVAVLRSARSPAVRAWGDRFRRTMAAPAAGDVTRMVRVFVAGKAADPIAVTFTPQERAVFDVIAEATENAAETPVVARVAGGWVRDKILGRPNHDIDVALDTMTGRSFAELVNDVSFMSAKMGKKATVSIIAANPDQSKHLETATMRVHDMWLDFVNLRSETYEDAGSRIPTMRFGTPAEDAERRDFTINSLFYNVNEDCIEDWTGRVRALRHTQRDVHITAAPLPHHPPHPIPCHRAGHRGFAGGHPAHAAGPARNLR